MRTAVLSIVALAALAVSAGTADAQWRGRGYSRGYYSTPYRGGFTYVQPRYNSYYATPYYGNSYYRTGPGFGLTIGNGYNFYPGNRYSTYPGYRYWW